jgi:ZIP family zinc transporter
MAMGAAHASGVQGLNVFIITAIALQNVPEGTAVAIPMQTAGFGKNAQFWAAVVSSIPQPIGAPLAYILVEYVEPLLAGSMAFAGGAMLIVVAVELVPKAFPRKKWWRGAVGAVAGAAVMAALGFTLGI